MNINAIGVNYYNTQNAKGYASSTSFRGEMSDAQMKKALVMLKEKVSCVQTCSTMNDVQIMLKNLMQKFERLGQSRNAAGMVVIPKEELTEFLGDKASRYNLKELVGICVAVGDKYGPVESWTKAYEAKVALLPKEIFR